jgi:transposase
VLENVKSKTALYLLGRYPSPEKLSRAHVSALGERMSRVSMGKFGLEEAKRLVVLARQTVGITEGLSGLVMDMKHILAQLAMLRAQIEEIEARMEAILRNIVYSPRLLAIKGLGNVTVAGLIGEVADFSKFKTQSEIMKLAGLDLYEISSRKRRGQRRISKRGRSAIRKLLYYAAIQMVRKGGIMESYYARLTGRGMIKMKALIAVSRKLLCIIHAIMRDGSDYAIDHTTKKMLTEAA